MQAKFYTSFLQYSNIGLFLHGVTVEKQLQ